MTDEPKKDEIAELRAEIERLKAKVDPPKSNFVPMTDAQHSDWVHQMRERRMSMAMPPSVHQYFADGVTAADCADLRQQARRPTGMPGMIPSSHQPSDVRAPQPSSTPGWVEPTPLGPPPGVAQADRLMDEQDRRDRI